MKPIKGAFARAAVEAFELPHPATLRQRLRANWLWKFVGTSFFMTAFFHFYFNLLRQPLYPVYEIPALFIDVWLPYQPLTWGFYLSLWVYVSLPVALQPNFWRLLYFGVGFLGLSIAGLVSYHYFPTVLSSHVSLYAAGQTPFLSGIDAPGNVFPSMHVAAAVFACGWNGFLITEMHQKKAVHYMNQMWALLIGYSTLATKQHVALDVMGGLILGLLFLKISLFGLRWISAWCVAHSKSCN